jgi:hypothetical protein
MSEKTEEIPLDPMRISVASYAMDRSGIQDSYCFRAVSLARALAQILVDGKGQLQTFSRKLPHYYYPTGTSDGSIWQHQSKFLQRWDSNPEFVKKFRKFSLPLFHKKAEEMVRATLLLPPTVPLSDAHVRRAVICACLTPLRQSVGSCFATAPAILVQGHYIDLFIDDLYELLTAGRLRRVVEGVQYTVPLSLTFGIGDLRKSIDPSWEFWASPGLIAALEAGELIPMQAPFQQKIQRARDALLPHYRPSMTVEQLLKKAIPSSKIEEAYVAFKSIPENALLKAWEFTLASFSDVKMEFSRWNLNWSVGLNPDEKGGIGEALYEALDAKLQEANQKIEEYHIAAQEAFDQLQMAERMSKQASTEAEIRRLKAEGQIRVHHLRVCEELRDEFQLKAKVYAEFFSFLIRQYSTKFQEYFQEIYDAEMPEIFKGPYEDRMAGFRLVFKHGRSDSSLWTWIHDQSAFIKALVEFFTLIEHPLTHSCQTAAEKKVVEEMTTVVIQHVRSDPFIQAVMARAKKDNRLPWAYLSGGSISQLVPLYFKTAPLKKEFREIQDELDLFVFLLDTMKSFLPKDVKRFLDDPSERLLIESPTHVFSFLPGLELFKEGWIDEGFTYTWIRDQFVLPGKEFYSSITLSPAEQQELMRRLSIDGQATSSVSIEMFCSKCRQIPEKELAAFLYRTLPLVPAGQCKAVLQKLTGVDHPVFPPELPDFLSSEEIQQLAKAQIDFDVDRHARIAARAQEIKLAPTPCIFADTNWPQGYFAFVIHPITLNLEVWKSDQTGSIAAPIPLVKTWLGKGKEFTWKLYTAHVGR